MKRRNLEDEMDLTQESVRDLTGWCIQIALHQCFGVGRQRLIRLNQREYELTMESFAVVMTPDANGRPQGEKARALRAAALPEGVPKEFRVPVLRAPPHPAGGAAEVGGRPLGDDGVAAVRQSLHGGAGLWAGPTEPPVCRGPSKLRADERRGQERGHRRGHGAPAALRLCGHAYRGHCGGRGPGRPVAAGAAAADAGTGKDLCQAGDPAGGGPETAEPDAGGGTAGRCCAPAEV